MNKFNPIEWLESRSKLNIQRIEIEGLPFEIMALTDEQVLDIKELDSSEDILSNAADMGLSLNRQRVFDDEELAKDLPMLWAHELMPLTDPTIKAQVGKKICEISGLIEHYQDAVDQEELEASALDRDNMTEEDLEMTMGQLERDATVAIIP